MPVVGGGGSANPGNAIGMGIDTVPIGGGATPMDWSNSQGWVNGGGGGGQTFAVAPPPGISVGGGGENNNSIPTGFSFSPPPLVLNGQSVAGGLNFTASLPVSQVDQASQAYAFTASATGDAYGFVSSAINAALSSAAATFQPIVTNETTLGQGELSALQTEAQALQTAAGKLGGGGGGLLGALGL